MKTFLGHKSRIVFREAQQILYYKDTLLKKVGCVWIKYFFELEEELIHNELNKQFIFMLYQ